LFGVSLAAMKQKGDIDGYAVVEQETKRFLAEKTVVTNDPPVCLVAAVGAYKKQVLTDDLDSRRRSDLLLSLTAGCMQQVKCRVPTRNGNGFVCRNPAADGMCS